MKSRYLTFYITYYSSMATSFSHLSDSLQTPLHLLRLSMSQPNFWYLYIIWSAAHTGHMPSITTSNNRKRPYLVNTEGRDELRVGFDQRRNMWKIIIMQEINFVVCGVLMGTFQLCSIRSSSTCFIRFEQLIIHFSWWVLGFTVDVETWLGEPHYFLFFGVIVLDY